MVSEIHANPMRKLGGRGRVVKGFGGACASTVRAVAAAAAKKWGGRVKDGGAGAEPPENCLGPRPFKTMETPFSTLGNNFLYAGNVLSQKAVFTLANFL